MSTQFTEHLRLSFADQFLTFFDSSNKEHVTVLHNGIFGNANEYAETVRFLNVNGFELFSLNLRQELSNLAAKLYIRQLQRKTVPFKLYIPPPPTTCPPSTLTLFSAPSIPLPSLPLLAPAPSIPLPPLPLVAPPRVSSKIPGGVFNVVM
jgi:hypothetical protein